MIGNYLAEPLWSRQLRMGRLNRRLARPFDWDSIRPNDPLVEFGTAAWNFVPLGTDKYFAASDFGHRPDLPRRLALFANTYGITDPSAVRWALQQAKQRSIEAVRYWRVSPGWTAGFFRLVADELDWLDSVTDDLYAQLNVVIWVGQHQR